MDCSNSPYRILFVDDEPAALKYFELFLREDVHVCTCSSAAEALATLNTREDEFDAIISDDRMPRMSGGELLGLVADRWPKMLRILTTAYWDLKRFNKLITDRVVDRVVLKPWEPDNLSKTVNEALREHRRKVTPSSAGQMRCGHLGTEKTIGFEAFDLRSHMLSEFALASQIRAPGFELAATNLEACLEDALRQLNAADRSLIAIEWTDIRSAPLRSNVREVGAALAELIANSVVVVRESKQGEVQLRMTADERKVSLLISDTGDWTRNDIAATLFGSDPIADDPRPGTGLLAAYLIILRCRGRISLSFDKYNRPQTIIMLPPLQN